MRIRGPYRRNGLKPEKMKIFEDESPDELEKKVEEWLLEKEDLVVIISSTYSMLCIPVQGGDLFQPPFKYVRSIIIWYCEQR